MSFALFPFFALQALLSFVSFCASSFCMRASFCFLSSFRLDCSILFLPCVFFLFYHSHKYTLVAQLTELRLRNCSPFVTFSGARRLKQRSRTLNYLLSVLFVDNNLESDIKRPMRLLSIFVINKQCWGVTNYM